MTADVTTRELEAELARAWTIDNLAVYGDHLLALGDPRGELIAVDVHVARHGRTPELQHRRRRALRTWLGLPAEIDPTRGIWEGVKFAFGFVDELRAETTLAVLRGPAGPFVRGLSLLKRPHAIGWMLDELAARPRPWLERLTIVPRLKGQPPTSVWSIDPGSFVAPPELVAALPRLGRLELAGHRLLRGFPHPGVTSLRVDGIDAFLPILEPSAAMPAVVELELSFAHAIGAPVTMQRPWPPLIPAESFPNLRRLDLSANDQRATTDTQIGVLDVIPSLGVRDQLVELRLPALIEPAEARRLRQLLRRMPALRRVELEYGPRFGFELEGVEVVEVRPRWPREPGAITGASVRIDGDPRVVELETRGILVHFSHAERWLDDGARAAWEEIWQVIEALPYGGAGYRMPSTRVRTALDALGFLDASFAELRGWVRLRDRLRDLDREREVWFGMDGSTGG